MQPPRFDDALALARDKVGMAKIHREAPFPVLERLKTLNSDGTPYSARWGDDVDAAATLGRSTGTRAEQGTTYRVQQPCPLRRRCPAEA